MDTVGEVKLKLKSNNAYRMGHYSYFQHSIGSTHRQYYEKHTLLYWQI
jgi:hypothetical protein